MRSTTALKIELQRLIGRAMVDVAFRAELIQDPVLVAEREGFILTIEDIEMLNRLNQPINNHIVNQVMTINPNNTKLQQLIGRAMINPIFRAELIQDPVRVAEREGFFITAEDVEILSKLDQFTKKRVLNQESNIQAPWN